MSSATASAARCWPRPSPTWRPRRTSASRRRPSSPRSPISTEAGRARRLHRRGAARLDGRDHGREGLSRRPRDGHDLQHAARQRPHLVLRDQQLSPRQGALPVRSPLLELRQHAHAGMPCTASICANSIRTTSWSKPGGITLDGVPIDLRKVRHPRLYALDQGRSYRSLGLHLCGDADHFGGISPSRSLAPATSQGVINPAGFEEIWLLAEPDKLPADPKDWLETATHHEGSWWPDWSAWVGKKSGTKVKARIPGKGKLEGDRGRTRQLCADQGGVSGAATSLTDRLGLAGRCCRVRDQERRGMAPRRFGISALT